MSETKELVRGTPGIEIQVVRSQKSGSSPLCSLKSEIFQWNGFCLVQVTSESNSPIETNGSFLLGSFTAIREPRLSLITISGVSRIFLFRSRGGMRLIEFYFQKQKNKIRWGFQPPFLSGLDIKDYSMGLYFLDFLRSLKFCNFPCFLFSISCFPVMTGSRIFKIKRACILLLQGVGKWETIITKGVLWVMSSFKEEKYIWKDLKTWYWLKNARSRIIYTERVHLLKYKSIK